LNLSIERKNIEEININKEKFSREEELKLCDQPSDNNKNGKNNINIKPEAKNLYKNENEKQTCFNSLKEDKLKKKINSCSFSSRSSNINNSSFSESAEKSKI